MRINRLFILICLYVPGVLLYACDITVHPVQFGYYSGKKLQTRGEIVIEHCATPARVKINAGMNSGGHFTARSMQNNAHNLVRYNLYLDTKHKVIWGDGTGGSKILHASEGRYMIYAQVPANQFVQDGAYRDRVEIIIEW